MPVVRFFPTFAKIYGVPGNNKRDQYACSPERCSTPTSISDQR
jgi:hypothetical protein